MLMHGDKKKIAALIIAKGKPGKEEISEAPMVDGAEQDNSVAEESSAQELMAAIQSKDAKGVVAAFKALMEICDTAEDMAEEEPISE